MKKTTLFLVSILALFAFTACEDLDLEQLIDEKPSSTQFQKNFGKETRKDFLGVVIDEEKNPIKDAKVSIEGKTAVTDDNGVFLIKNAKAYERFAYITVKKEGYLNGSRSVTPTKGTNNVTIMMLKETVSGKVESGKDGAIETKDGAIIKLQGKYIKKDGTPYNGTVNVITHFLNPADENIDSKMPGMLYAENAQGEERMLQTFGMIAVELRGTANEKLNLAPGAPAEISFPIDPSLLATAPATIPLWHFDENKGYWIEDGEANKVGSYYIGKVTHFSFWNCDIPAQAITLCVTLENTNGNPIANAKVGITSTIYGTRYGYTNANGEVCGLVPQNESLVLNVYNTACGNTSIHTSNVGPFSQNATITEIVNNNATTTSETIVGILNSCNNTPVNNGYITLTYGGQTFNASVTNGNFQINILKCSTINTFDIDGADLTNLQTAGLSNLTFTSPTTNIGTLTACSTLTEYIQYTLDGTQNTILDNIYATYNISSNKLNITTKKSQDLCYLTANLNPAPSLGTYTNSCSGSIGFNIAECLQMDTCNSPAMSYNLTTLGTTVGSYIDINFSGTYLDTSGNTHTINGIYHVLIDTIQ